MGKSKEFESLEEIPLFEFINGLEAKQLFVDSPINGLSNIEWLECCRRLQDLYDEIASARFALIMGSKGFYSELLSAEEGQQSHVWIQCEFLKNAIIWYNNAFDIYLQALYVYYGVYKRNGTSIQDCNFTQILRSCKFTSFTNSNIPRSVFDKLNSFSKDVNSQTIREWANTMKHRKMIRFQELAPKHGISYLVTESPINIRRDKNSSKVSFNVENIVYCSDNSITLVTIPDVICKMKKYHNSFYCLVNSVFDI